MTRARRRIADPRLILGLLLVGASTAGVVGLVTSLDDREAVYVAAHALVPGERVRVEDLRERPVAVGQAGERYLTPGSLPEGGAVVLRPVEPGEFVPRSALGDPSGIDTTAVVLEVADPLASQIREARTVEVWASRASHGGDSVGEPVVIVPEAVVMRVRDGTGLVSTSSGVWVEVLVPHDRVARVLQARADGELLALVPVGIPIGG
ncbi:hypothetical protein [Homoserinibacter sp. GY 40078]|uniref:hypothetical protein n=1 Tax=Homoserinibacter sp. GY 40078 TaxID=2603275 RepID=UPI0011C832C4|nr:hypothetical protein [Homoserinibacter sp. GY 40078]TXK16302.1 hypothetical protein FVQ89_13680 [Homoserinibacter sp. GY 40078]